MPFLNATGLSLVDIALLAVIIIGLPLEALLTLKKGRAELASGAPGVRIKRYTQTIMLLWGIALPLIVLWAVSDRSWADLGFQIQTGPLAYAGWGLAALMAIFFTYQFSMVSRLASVREQFRSSLAQDTLMSDFLPQNDEERRLFNLVGVTAGITEEIIFRGYLIWALALFMPLWVAAGGALLIFTVLHLYQGAKRLPTIFLFSAMVTLVFVLSGSLWPAIALHIFGDVINNSTIWKARAVPA